MNVIAADLPELQLCLLSVILPTKLGELPAPDWLPPLLRADAEHPLRVPEGQKAAVRDLLRGHGYRPTGRGKPSSEYLAQAAAEGRLAAINPLVDLCNAVSLHAQVPISVVDTAQVVAPLAVAIPGPGSSYAFNASGQVIDVAGLVSLVDAVGPCANAVKDSQRTKTGPATTRALILLWGTRHPDPALAPAAADWLAALLRRLGLVVERDA